MFLFLSAEVHCNTREMKDMTWRDACRMIKKGQNIKDKKILGKINFKDLANRKNIVTYSINLQNCHVGNMYGNDIVYGKNIHIDDCKINYIGFKNCKFSEDILINNCSVQHPTFVNNKFIKNFKMVDCNFYQLSLFQNNIFNDWAEFRNIKQVGDALRIQNCIFNNYLWLMDCDFNIFEFSNNKLLNGNAHFWINNCVFKENCGLNYSEFNCWVHISYCRFLKNLYFTSYGLPNEKNRHTTFRGGLRFSDVIVEKTVDLRGAVFNSHFSVDAFGYGKLKIKWKKLISCISVDSGMGPNKPNLSEIIWIKEQHGQKFYTDRDLDFFTKLYRNYINLGWLHDARSALFQVKWLETRKIENNRIRFLRKLVFEKGVGYFIDSSIILKNILLSITMFTLIYLIPNILKSKKYFQFRLINMKVLLKNICKKAILKKINEKIESAIRKFSKTFIFSLGIFFRIQGLGKDINIKDSVFLKSCIVFESVLAFFLMAALIASFTNGWLM